MSEQFTDAERDELRQQVDNRDRTIGRLLTDLEELRKAAKAVLENHEAIEAVGTAQGAPLNVQHWININRLKAAVSGDAAQANDAELAASGLEQIMLIRLGKANQERDDWKARYEALRTSVRQCAERMDGSGVKFDLLELVEPQEARS